MKTITLISRWNDQTLNLRISEESYAKLLKSESYAILLINEDLDRVHYGHKPQYISEYQAKRINRFFAKCNSNYFSKVEF